MPIRLSWPVDSVKPGHGQVSLTGGQVSLKLTAAT